VDVNDALLSSITDSGNQAQQLSQRFSDVLSVIPDLVFTLKGIEVLFASAEASITALNADGQLNQLLADIISAHGACVAFTSFSPSWGVNLRSYLGVMNTAASTLAVVHNDIELLDESLLGRLGL
jgi:hypothetical protein